MERLFACPHCRKAIRLAPTVTGPVKVLCPLCGKPFLVPAPVPPKAVLEVKPVEDEVLDVVPVEEPVLEVKPVTRAPVSPPPAAGQTTARPAARVVPAVAAPPAREKKPIAIPVGPAIPAARRAADDLPPARPADEGVTAAKDRPAPAPRRPGTGKRKGPRFSDEPATGPRRQPINRAVIVSAVVACLAVVSWLGSFFGISLPGGFLVIIFLGSLFGGMYASSLTSVARFRHSLYAGLWAFGVLLIFVVPVSLLMVWYGSAMREISSGKADDGLTAAYDLLTGRLGTVFLCFFLAPILIVTGFLLGGITDVMTTTVARSLGSRERWTYHTHDGKSFPVEGPWRYPVLAAFWSVVGWIILLTCWVPLLSGQLLGVLAAVALGQACRTLAKKRRAMSAKDALEADKRPPIIYLRSFQDDGLFQPGTFFLINDWLRTLNEKSAEDNLSGMLAPFGPVVAIGRPGEEMPEVGAARIYVGDDHWQDLIMDLLSDRGALAVFQAGSTRGLRWELETITSRLRPEQILMFLPFALHWSRSRRDADYASFRAWASECVPSELPEKLGDGVFFYYFTAKPALKTRVLGPESRVSPKHPLSEVLTDIQTSKSLHRWRLVNWRRFWKLLLGGLLVAGITAGVKALWHYSTDDGTPPQEAEAAVVKPANPPPAAPPPQERSIRYEGKARPYHVSLGPAWEQKKPDPNEDLSFTRGDSAELVVLLADEKKDLADFGKNHVERLKKKTNPDGTPQFRKVNLLDDRKVRVNGRDWYDFKVEYYVGEKGHWQRVRCYSDEEGSIFIQAFLAEDDPALDRELTRAFDTFELPPPP